MALREFSNQFLGTSGFLQIHNFELNDLIYHAFLFCQKVKIERVQVDKGISLKVTLVL